MAFKDLREYIAELESRGLLKRITTEVDCQLEIVFLTDSKGNVMIHPEEKFVQTLTNWSSMEPVKAAAFAKGIAAI